MSKIINFDSKKPKKKSAIDTQAQEMLKVADEIDQIILQHIGKAMDPRDMAGLLAHRLGTLMKHVKESDRKILWVVVEKVLREQADLQAQKDASDF